MESELKQFYETYDEEGRLLTRPGNVEFVTTMHFVERYLRPGMRILEVGAATGRYSHHLARMGCRVDAVELVQHNIDLFNANTRPGEDITITRGNAMDLSMFPENTFDLTLVLGPMYHLFERSEQEQALREAIRVTKRGGVIFAAYCMLDASILQYGFRQGELKTLIAENRIDTETFGMIRQKVDLFCLYRRDQIDALRARFPVKQLHFAATDGYAKHMQDALAEMDEETYRHYLRYHLVTCERADMVGISHHTLDIFRKE